MEMKTQNQISHDMWFKEWGHSKLQTDDLSSRKLLTDNSENIGTEKMLATDFSSLNLNSGF